MSDIYERLQERRAELRAVQREAEVLPVLKAARELVANQHHTGSLVRIGRDGEPSCYCALGAIARASDPDVSDRDLANIMDMTDVNPVAVSALATELVSARYPGMHGHDIVWRVNDGAFTGQARILDGLDKAIAKLEAE